MVDPQPPEGFCAIATSPRDGTFVKLRFRSGCGREEIEEIGAWREDEGVPAWWRQDGSYITPGPLFWAPLNGGWH